MGDEPSKPPDGDERDKDELLLKLAERRRDGSDQFTWTVPSLGLTAEAFLLTVALAGDTEPLGRLVAVIAGVVCLLGAIHFLNKQSYGFNLYDAVIERQLARLNRMSAHLETLEALDFPEKSRERLNRAGARWGVRGLGSVDGWQAVLWSLVVVDVLIGGYAIWALVSDPGWL